MKRTSHGNYKLKDKLGEVLKASISRHKLKVVEEEDNEEIHYEAEKILNHKRHGNGYRYLVKW